MLPSRPPLAPPSTSPSPTTTPRLDTTQPPIHHLAALSSNRRLLPDLPSPSSSRPPSSIAETPIHRAPCTSKVSGLTHRLTQDPPAITTQRRLARHLLDLPRFGLRLRRRLGRPIRGLRIGQGGRICDRGQGARRGGRHGGGSAAAAALGVADGWSGGHWGIGGCPSPTPWGGVGGREGIRQLGAQLRYQAHHVAPCRSLPRDAVPCASRGLEVGWRLEVGTSVLRLAVRGEGWIFDKSAPMTLLAPPPAPPLLPPTVPGAWRFEFRVDGSAVGTSAAGP